MTNSSRSKCRVLFVIRSLNRGGAEGQLVSLAKGLVSRGHSVTVLTLYADGALSAGVAAAGALLFPVGKRGRWDLLGPLWRSISYVRRLRPHVVHGYLPVGNLLALMLGRLSGARVVWGIRASRMDTAMYDWLNLLSVRVAAWCAGLADLIISNSRSGAADHIADGFPANRVIVIPNGFDSTRFRPDAGKRRSARDEWGIRDSTLVIGHVGRLDPVKDHALLFRAVADLCRRHSVDANAVRIVCMAMGDRSQGAAMERLVSELRLAENVRWLWNIERPEDIYPAFDAVAMTSNSEGFPNVVGEAMSCGVPCIATNVGDTAWLLDDCGIVVPPRDVDALSDAFLRFLGTSQDERRALGARARQRVIEQYDLERLMSRTEEALRSVVAGRRDASTRSGLGRAQETQRARRV